MVSRFLTKHPNGQWCRRIRGKVTYLGTNYDDALLRWYRAAHGGDPGERLLNVMLGWLEWKESLDLSPRTLEGYRWAAGKALGGLGRNRQVDCIDPCLVERWLMDLGVGVYRKRHALMVLKSALRWGHQMGMCQVPRGIGLWKGPSERELRGARKGPSHAWKVREIVALTTRGIKRGRLMALLGINLGYGMSDLCSAVQVQKEGDDWWVGGPRVKTGVPRLGWLWPETRILWEQSGGPPLGRGRARHLYREWARHVHLCGLERAGRGHYDLRATLRTHMGGKGDSEAARLVMGHEQQGIDRFYVREIVRSRVKSLLESARASLLGLEDPRLSS